MTPEDLKQAVKEAAKEWLDDQLAKVGKWTLNTIAAFILVGIVILIAKFT